MTTPESRSVPAFRDHPLRRVQTLLQPASDAILHSMHYHGLLENTRIAQTIESGRQLHADDVTFSNLQLTVQATDRIIEDGPKSKHIAKWLIGWSLDGFDGAIARLRGEAGPDGAVKDAVLDRLGELYIAKRIGEEVAAVTGRPYTRIPTLMAAMQFSTLTKSACEMCGVQTSERGLGSMLGRRPILLDTVIQTAKLRQATQSHDRINHINAISQNVETIINRSTYSAGERVRKLRPWYSPDLRDLNSAAAIEARKFAVLVLVNRKFRIDLLKRLSDLSPGTPFPTIKDLLDHLYISTALAATKPFIDQAITLTGLSENGVRGDRPHL